MIVIALLKECALSPRLVSVMEGLYAGSQWVHTSVALGC